MPHTPDHQDPNEFGYIYDWLDQYELPDTLVDINDQDTLLLKLYNTMTSGLEKPLPFEKWKEIYGYYVDPYNPAQEELTQEAFDIKVDQTEDLFALKTEQENRNYELIEKYSAIDDSDDFESSTEMAIRHNKEQAAVEDKLNRYNLISKGLDLTGKIKEEEHKSVLKNLRSGDTDALSDELNKSFWANMKVVRSKYDKSRLSKNQALDSLILKSEQVVDSAFASKEDTIQTSLINAQNNMKNAAVDLLQDKISQHEDYDESLWDTMGNLAENEAFEAECLTDGDCDGDYRCINNNCTYYPPGHWCDNGDYVDDYCDCLESANSSSCVGVGDQPPIEPGAEIADADYCTQICIPVGGGGMVGPGGMTCYDSCLGTPTFGDEAFTPQLFDWIDRAEAEANCPSGNLQWNTSTGNLDCIPSAGSGYAEQYCHCVDDHDCLEWKLGASLGGGCGKKCVYTDGSACNHCSGC